MKKINYLQQVVLSYHCSNDWFRDDDRWGVFLGQRGSKKHFGTAAGKVAA
jgi:hypothetical protein